MIEQSYNFGLASLSVVVATLGAYVAIEIAQYVRASGGRRVLWGVGGALALGLSIWSMHFVGMLALRLPVFVWYDVLLVFVSMVAAVGGCAIAFIIFNRPTVNFWQLSLASIFMGLAIASMHYTAMAGMETSARISYDPLIVGASIGVAIVVSFAALALTRSLIENASENRAWVKKLGASLLLGFAIAGMRFAASRASAAPTSW